MAKWEIHRRFGFVDALWWRWMPGTEVTVKWPVGEIVVDHNDPRWIDIGGAVTVSLGTSADPNDHYRMWLEQHVGRQGWDWNWKIGPAAATNDAGTVIGFDTLVIKFRKAKEKYATIAAMRWA